MWSSFTLSFIGSPQALAERLNAALRDGNASLRGFASPDGFKITRVFSWWERGFPIVMRGAFITVPGGTEVRVTTRPSITTLIVVIFVTATLLWTWYFHTSPTDWFAPWFFCGGIAFFWCVAFVGTVIEEQR